MIVKCINNDLYKTVSVEKEYSVLDGTDTHYTICDDNGNKISVESKYFHITVDSELVKNIKATMSELNYQLSSNAENITKFQIKKNSKGFIKEIKIKFYYD